MHRDYSVATAVVVALCLSACDFSGVGSAGDDFDLIFEMPEINTVVSAQGLDAATLEPIDGLVNLRFGGEDALHVVDAYSDPISSLRFRNGFVTFGIENGIVPDSLGPVAFTVSAQAEGYLAQGQQVALYDSVGTQVLLRMISEDPTVPVVGTSGVVEEMGTASGEGTVSDEVIVTAESLPGASAAPSITIGAGTLLRTADGTPLSGNLTTSIRFFDGEDGLLAVSEAARVDAEGNALPVYGGVDLHVFDQRGREADAFDATSGKAIAFAAGGLMIRIPVSRALFNRALANVQEGTCALGVRRFDPAVGELVPDSGCTATLDPATSTIVMTGDCAGLVAVTCASARRGSCEANATMVLSNPNGVPAQISRFEVTGNGIHLSSIPRVTVPADSTVSLPINAWLNKSASVPIGSFYTIAATVDGETVSFSRLSACSGRHTLTLPPAPAMQPYLINATLACPSGRKLDPLITRSSFSAMTVAYREEGSEGPFLTLARDTVFTSATQRSVTATGPASLKSNTPYEFVAVWGSGAAHRVQRTPVSSQAFSVALPPEQLGLTCRAE